MPEFPEGAVKSKEELLEHCKKLNGKPFFYYLVFTDHREMEKRIVRHPYIKGPKLEPRREILNDNAGRYLYALGLEENYCHNYPISFMFLNYWNAFAYSERQKQRLALDAKQAV
jgi:hypothetical protein